MNWSSYLNQTPAEIKKALPLPWVTQAYGVELEHNGRAVVGLCPFHDDHNPSLQISGAGLDRWICYPCGEGGDIFDFIQKAENLRFSDSLDVAANLLRRFASDPNGVQAW